MTDRRREGSWTPPVFEKPEKVEVVHWWNTSQDLRRKRLKKKWQQIEAIRLEEPIRFGTAPASSERGIRHYFKNARARFPVGPFAGRQTPGSRDDDGVATAPDDDVPRLAFDFDNAAARATAAQQALERFTSHSEAAHPGEERFTPRDTAAQRPPPP